MEELLIEEKAKRYDEALERAKTKLTNEVAADIFPELKESEDERIRKALIRFHKSTIDVDGIKGGDILAWLEKQGEKKSIDDLTQQEAMDIAVAKCFEQGKQKSEEVDNLHNYLYGEQNPAWSEEDEMHIRELESLVKQVWAIAERENDKDKIHKMSDLSFFLKTLKPQPKQEWGEEDERLRKDIVNYLECQKEEEPTRKDKINSWISWILKHSFSEWTKKEKEAWNKILDRIIDILDWAEEKGCISLSDCQDYSIMLKSLRPQNTWKPSDEQMDALHYVTNFDYGGHKATLVSLYEQLKKLK